MSSFDFNQPGGLIYNVPDHMVVLSFNGDTGAEYFNEWWNGVGYRAFLKYAKRREHDEAQ